MDFIVVLLTTPAGETRLHGVFANMEQAQGSAIEDKKGQPSGTSYRLMRAELGLAYQGAVPGTSFI